MRKKRAGLFVTCLAVTWIATMTTTAAAAAPETRTPAPTPPAASSAEAKELFAKAIEALGGNDRIVKIRSVQTRGQVSAKTPGGEMTMEMETTMVFPDQLAQQVDAPFGRFAMVATPSGASITGSEGPSDLPPATRDELLRQVRRTAFFLAQKADDPKLAVQLGGEEKIGEVSARILDVSYADVSVRWFVDPASGRILRSSHESAGMEGKPVHVVSNFSDFQTADGITLPHRIDVVTEGSPDQTVVLEEIKFNPVIDPKIFEKPAPPTPKPTAKPTAKPAG